VVVSDDKPVVLGRISGLFGVKGWFRVHSYTDPREAILDYGNWLVGKQGGWRPAKLAEGQRHGKTVIARLDGVDDRDTAAGFVDEFIGVAREGMPPPADGEYYWSDLEGLTVIHCDGKILGKVAHLLETGANDVLVVRGDREILIPYVANEVIEDVDLVEGVIRVNWEWD
jgi:16S rRNA processing protein RimM